MRQMYSRDTRRQFCPPGHWINDKIVLPQDRSDLYYIKYLICFEEVANVKVMTCVFKDQMVKGQIT